MLVRDIMSEDIVSTDVSDSLQDAVVAMLRAGVGSVVVYRQGTPTGILTETDALVAAAKTGSPFDDIDVADVMTRNLVTGQPDMTVRKAVRVMNQNGVKKLPITADFEVVGILTISDVVRHHSSLIKEAHRLEEDRSRWRSDWQS